MLLIVNPANGPGPSARPGLPARDRARPGERQRACWATSRRRSARGPATDVEADVARYRDWYGVDGIFLDEVAHDGVQLPYYVAL